eukprot:scaffold1990_cov196-Alexandrium_tamarense.AAC.9
MEEKLQTNQAPTRVEKRPLNNDDGRGYGASHSPRLLGGSGSSLLSRIQQSVVVKSSLPVRGVVVEEGRNEEVVSPLECDGDALLLTATAAAGSSSSSSSSSSTPVEDTSSGDNDGGGGGGPTTIINNSNSNATPAPTTPTKQSNNTTTTSTPLLSTRSPNDVSKEELLEILKKMNTRVKTLSQSRIQLADKVQTAERDKARLLALVKGEIVGEADYEEAKDRLETMRQSQGGNKDGSSSGGEPDEIMVLQSAWRNADERHQLNLQHIQNEYKVMTLQAQAEVEKVRMSVIEEKVSYIFVVVVGGDGGGDVSVSLILARQLLANQMYTLVSLSFRIRRFKE